MAMSRLEILDAFVAALDRRQDVIAIVPDAPNLDDARRGLRAAFGWSDNQAHAVLDLQLLRFNAEMRDRVSQERAFLRAEVGFA